MPPGKFAEAALAARLVKLIEQAGRCSATPDADEVHDLRVAIRRFSQALLIFKPLLETRAVKQMRRDLKGVMDAAAAVRDLDVGMERLIAEGLPENHTILEEMRAERRRGELALRGRLLLLEAEEPARIWPAAFQVRQGKAPRARTS